MILSCFVVHFKCSKILGNFWILQGWFLVLIFLCFCMILYNFWFFFCFITPAGVVVYVIIVMCFENPKDVHWNKNVFVFFELLNLQGCMWPWSGKTLSTLVWTQCVHISCTHAVQFQHKIFNVLNLFNIVWNVAKIVGWLGIWG